MEENGSAWQELYRLALLELDKEKLGAAIERARQAIDARLKYLENQSPEQPSEMQALNDALHNLRVLSRELGK